MNCNDITKKRFFLLSLIPLYFIIMGLILQPLPSIIKGLIKIILEPDLLITDYFVIGGIGAAFVNAGILTLLTILGTYILGMDVDGHTLTACCLIFGFSLFGKNLLNIWSILFGVYLYARYHRTSLKEFYYIGIYGTCLSPIITQLMTIEHLPPGIGPLLSLLVGIIIGFVLPPLCTHVHYAHKGYSLYNVGFAAGIIAIVITSLMKSFGIESQARLIWDTQHKTISVIILLILFLSMILLSLIHNYKNTWNSYKKILKTTGVGGCDYLNLFGINATVFNMGINGLVALCLVLFVGGDLNGPTIGATFCVVGFSATGKHLRNILPIMIGVVLSGYIKIWNIHDPAVLLALLFSTTLAPIAGQFGILIGILAGVLHSSTAINISAVYDGMNLYNNGFAGGLVAIFLVPVIQSFRTRKALAKGDISL